MRNFKHSSLFIFHCIALAISKLWYEEWMKSVFIFRSMKSHEELPVTLHGLKRVKDNQLGQNMKNEELPRIFL